MGLVEFLGRLANRASTEAETELRNESMLEERMNNSSSTRDRIPSRINVRETLSPRANTHVYTRNKRLRPIRGISPSISSRIFPRRKFWYRGVVATTQPGSRRASISISKVRATCRQITRRPIYILSQFLVAPIFLSNRRRGACLPSMNSTKYLICRSDAFNPLNACVTLAR